MTYLIVLAMAAIVLGLLWAWWAGRLGRDPAGSVDSFHRALAAMQPGSDRGTGAQEQRVGAEGSEAVADGADDPA